MSRRKLIAGASGGVILGSVGIFGWWYINSPHRPVEKFTNRVSEGDYTGANELIHTEAQVQGAGALFESLASIFPANIQEGGLDLSIEGMETLERGGGEAVVDCEAQLSVANFERTGTVRFWLRKEEGNWRIWNFEF